MLNIFNEQFQFGMCLILGFLIFDFGSVNDKKYPILNIKSKINNQRSKIISEPRLVLLHPPAAVSLLENYFTFNFLPRRSLEDSKIKTSKMLFFEPSSL